MRRAVFIVTISLVAFSCSQYSKLLKSSDNEAKYRAALGYYAEKKNDRAISLFTAVAPYFASSVRTDSIGYMTAVSYYRMGDYITSGELLEDFKIKYPYSDFMEEVEYLIAMGYYYASPPANRDQTNSRRAMAAFYEYLDHYPYTHKKEECLGYVEELMAKLYEKELVNAKVYYHMEYYKAAVYALKTALNDNPDTPRREEFLYLITKASYLLATNSVEELRHSRYLDMMDAYYNLISEFPQTSHLAEVETMYEEVQRILEQNGDQTDS